MRFVNTSRSKPALAENHQAFTLASHHVDWPTSRHSDFSCEPVYVHSRSQTAWGTLLSPVLSQWYGCQQAESHGTHLERKIAEYLHIAK